MSAVRGCMCESVCVSVRVLEWEGACGSNFEEA